MSSPQPGDANAPYPGGDPPPGAGGPGWDAGIARLRLRVGVPAALAVAAALLVARERWSERVVVHTAGHEVLFTRPGDDYPFTRDVRLGLRGKTYDLRLVAPTGVLAGQQVSPAEVDAALAEYLTRLTDAG